jgi:hypothetical protein
MNFGRSLALLFGIASTGCVGSAGGELFELPAYAAGALDAGPSVSFTNSLGYEISLTRASLYVGGVYLNRSRPTSVGADTSCTLSGTYVMEVLGGREVDLLSPAPQPFPQGGVATSDRALSAEVWLSDGDVDRIDSAREILRVTGTAKRDGVELPFEGELSIGKNRVIAPTDPALPGQHPICKQRIVSPIVVDLAAGADDALLLRIDVRGMFGNVDFSTLPRLGESYRFADEGGANQASDNLFAGLRRSSGVYQFSWWKEKKP